MRHHNSFKKLGRNSAQRRAMLRSLATSFLKNESCQTTIARAKQLKGVVEPLIRSARSDNLAARRAAYSYLLDKGVVHKLFSEIGPRFSARNGGYTRVIRTGFRHGDAAQLAVIQMIESAAAQAPTKPEKKAPARKKAESKPKAEAKASAKSAEPKPRASRKKAS